MENFLVDALTLGMEAAATGFSILFMVASAANIWLGD